MAVMIYLVELFLLRFVSECYQLLSFGRKAASVSPYQSIADVLGPWRDPGFNSGLIERCKQAWTKPLKELSNQELATFLRQKIAVAHLLPFARQRAAGGFDDDSEWYEGQLAHAIDHADQST